MEYAFPWLFPGGTGGYMSGWNPKPNLKDWLNRDHIMISQVGYQPLF
jgi:hypothetical protein